MEEVIRKLSEIEITAQKIMDEAQLQKQALSAQMKQQIDDYDKKLEKDTSARISNIRKSLEVDKEKKLNDLNQKTQDTLKTLDQYYNENHSRLSQEIFDKIIRH